MSWQTVWLWQSFYLFCRKKFMHIRHCNTCKGYEWQCLTDCRSQCVVGGQLLVANSSRPTLQPWQSTFRYFSIVLKLNMFYVSRFCVDLSSVNTFATACACTLAAHLQCTQMIHTLCRGSKRRCGWNTAWIAIIGYDHLSLAGRVQSDSEVAACLLV